MSAKNGVLRNVDPNVASGRANKKCRHDDNDNAGAAMAELFSEEMPVEEVTGDDASPAPSAAESPMADDGEDILKSIKMPHIPKQASDEFFQSKEISEVLDAVDEFLDENHLIHNPFNPVNKTPIGYSYSEGEASAAPAEVPVVYAVLSDSRDSVSKYGHTTQFKTRLEHYEEKGTDRTLIQAVFAFGSFLTCANEKKLIELLELAFKVIAEKQHWKCEGMGRLFPRGSISFRSEEEDDAPPHRNHSTDANETKQSIVSA
jgi:hypothetical protein